MTFLAKLGFATVEKGRDFFAFLDFIGEQAVVAISLFPRLRRLHYRSFLATFETAGFQALPIIGLLSFLIGVVLAYQMGLQLSNYGANIYVVNLLGISILREFAPLITAIIVAGRTGSAFTAQLGTMKIREEIDALKTMGITVNELLIVPRILAMMLIVPLLTIWSMIFGVLGGMVMSKYMFSISYYDFLMRFQDAISVRSFMTGMVKTPVFGILIAAIGCFQGLRVTGSSVSVGKQTTVSVVQAVFFIIIADAIFSIVFSTLRL